MLRHPRDHKNMTRHRMRETGNAPQGNVQTIHRSEVIPKARSVPLQPRRHTFQDRATLLQHRLAATKGIRQWHRDRMTNNRGPTIRVRLCLTFRDVHFLVFSKPPIETHCAGRLTNQAAEWTPAIFRPLAQVCYLPQSIREVSSHAFWARLPEVEVCGNLS